MNNPKLPTPVEVAQQTQRSKDFVTENWAALLEIWAQTARTKKAKYDAYVKAGFSTTDALYIVAHEA